MPTWCHLLNSMLTGNARVWFDDLSTESIDSYDDLKKAFLENYLQQKKCIKMHQSSHVLHHIKLRDGESREDFVKILFPPLDEDEGIEGPMIIEAEIRGHCIHRMIIGRLGVKKLQVVPSTTHGMLKLPVEGGVITLKSSRLVPLECALVSGPEETLPATKPIVEERVKVAINPEYPKQTVMIGSTLTEEGRNKLCGLL
ncbi:reverse transcriptase domain-containing protein [Tanacetum coccineum]